MQPQLHTYHIATDIVAFSSTRLGGVSNDAYSEFNINLWCGDSVEHTSHNLLLLAEELGILPDRIIMPHQVHKTEIGVVDDSFFGLSISERTQLLDGVDAVITNQHGVCVGVSTADCIPVLLYDAEHGATAAIHAGWRGTQQCIVEKTVKALQENYNTNPENLKAIIGPGISLQAFEVGQEVYDAFAEAGFNMTAIACMQEKWHIDLPLCNKLQLQNTGVKPENILSTGICTYSQHDEYFSARRLGIHSGRIFTAIMMK